MPLMNLFCCFTPAHEVLFKEYFLPSVPEGFSVRPTRFDIEGAGDFLSAEFIRCICRKVELILESIREHSGGVIVWSDIDIQFFDVSPEALLSHLGEHDIAFQREGPRVPDVNTGFFVCRCNARTLGFFERVKEGLERDPRTNEQYVANRLLGRNPDLLWAYLPPGYYARTHGWPPPRGLALYHANATPGKGGVAMKIAQFRELAFLHRFRPLALAVTGVKYAPKRIRRLLSERLFRRLRPS